jgi:hypothetical protein
MGVMTSLWLSACKAQAVARQMEFVSFLASEFFSRHGHLW